MILNKKSSISLLVIIMMILSALTGLAADTEETLNMYRYETYSFENNSDGTVTICIGNGYQRYYDCVLYDGDGKFLKCYSNYSLDTMDIPAGGRIFITATGMYTDVTYPKGSISFKKEDNPCFETSILLSGTTYSLKNMSGEDMPLFGVGEIPYVLYDQEGNIVEYKVSGTWGTTGDKVPAGYTVKFQNPTNGTSKKLSYVRGSFVFNTEALPVFDTTTILQGDSYRFKNISDKVLTIFSAGGERDWRLYDENGVVVEEGLKTTWGSGGAVEKNISAGYTLELSLTHAIDVNTLHGFFNIEKLEDAKATRVFVNAGETYSFTNKTTGICKMVTDSGTADLYNDYAIFDKNGSLVSRERKGKWSTMTLSPGETIKLTPRCRTMEIAIFEDEIAFKKESAPVITRNIIGYGEQYSFENISSTERTILSDSYGSYEIRDADGNITESVDGGDLNGVRVPAGHTIYVTATGNTTECAVLSDSFISKKVSDPEGSDYIDLIYGKTYKITNNSTTRYTFGASDYDITHAHISYYQSGKEYSSSFGTSYDFSIYAGGYAYITLYVNTSIYNSPNLSIEEVEDPVYEGKEMVPGQIYSFENLTDEDSVFVSFNSLVDHIEYDTAGNVIGCYGDDYGAYVYGKYFAKTNAYYSTAYYPTGKIKFSTESQIDIGVAEFSKGDRGRMVSNLTNEIWLTFQNGNVRYAQYNSEGEVENISLDDYMPTLFISQGGYADIEAVGKSRIVYPSEYVKYEKLDQSPFEYKTFSEGDTVLIKADSSKDTAIRIFTNIYDYVKYDKNNQITEYEMNRYCGNIYLGDYTEEIFLSAGESIAITVKESELTLMTVEGSVTVQKRAYPALERKVINPNGTYAYTNLYDTSVNILSESYEYDYILYDESDKIKKSENTNAATLAVKPMYRIEITNGDEPAIIALPYEIYHAEDFAVKVTGVSVSEKYLTLGLNESKVLTATIAPQNATFKGVTWSSSDTGVATVSSTGSVTGIKEGSAIITVTSKDGGFTATCEVLVTDLSAKGIILNESYAIMKVGEKRSFEATVLPLFASDRNVVWSTSSSRYASVSSNGEVEALLTGNIEIYAKTSDGKYTATCKVQIIPADKETDNVITMGSAKVKPGETVDVTVKISGNSDIYNIDLPLYYDNSTFTLTAVKVGDTPFTLNYSTKNMNRCPFSINLMKNEESLIDGKEYTLVTFSFTASESAKSGSYQLAFFDYEESVTDEEFMGIPYNVTVGEITVEAEEKTIALGKNKLTINEGYSATLKASVVGGDGSEKLIWGSSDYSVVSVKDGTIRAIAPGTATVTVSTDDYKVYTSCTVVVTEAGEPSIGDITITQNGNKTKISLEGKNLPPDVWMLVATYTSKNKMISLQALDSDENGLYSAEVSLEEVGKVTVFAFESITNIKPLCPAKTKTDFAE